MFGFHWWGQSTMSLRVSHWVRQKIILQWSMETSGKLAENLAPSFVFLLSTLQKIPTFFSSVHLASACNRRSHGSPNKNGKSEAADAFLKVLWAKWHWFLLNLVQFLGGPEFVTQPFTGGKSLKNYHKCVLFAFPPKKKMGNLLPVRTWKYMEPPKRKAGSSSNRQCSGAKMLD